MGRTRRRLSSFCHNGVATRVRKRAQRVNSKAVSNGVGANSKAVLANAGRMAMDNGGKKDSGRRIMVVADMRSEAKGALQWALAQAVQSDDTVVLLNVVRQAKDGGDSLVKVSKTRSYEHLDAMRNLCESSRPGVKVELCIVEAEERGPAIVEAARRQGASLLVLGQKRPAVRWWLLMMWSGNRCRRGGMVEYCIQHAPCMTLGVRRRSSGGYLITSKRHKDFWLLA